MNFARSVGIRYMDSAGFLIYLFLFCSFLKNNLSLNSSSPANDFSFSFLMFS